MSGEAERRPADGDAEEIGRLIGRLSGDEKMDRETRGRLLVRLARLLGTGGRRAGATGRAGGRRLADLLIEAGPHIPVRDLETLRRHHHGLLGEQLADSLVRVAVNNTTLVGAAGGALSAVQFTAPPLLLSTPAQLAAETLALAAIEVKLIAELHEVYGVQVPGSVRDRGTLFVSSWARQRGINPLDPGSLTVALGAAARTAISRRLLRTLGRTMTTMGPFLTGAIAGGALNRAATKKLADVVRADLRRHLGPAPDRRALP
ncbi:hypothetical protein DPM19_28660 [Actinomadura craniellae]|uniref:EcsC family protein n=1 Tax=Actinomadura craniellae TaxID=2231787 RepID=A0A365GXW4_9ACTN|nr:hypothetical protein [Actinomadura craniellae]RAY11608.1 hypothetical protein DPM19_28660 [Actinomadura craniellae]